MSLTARGFAAITLVAAFTGTLAPPASAGQAAAPQVEVFLPDVLIAAGSVGTEVNALAGASEFVELENLVLKVDFSDLDGVAKVGVDPVFCDVAGSVASCDLGDVILDPVAALEPVFEVVPAVGAAAGASGKWKATISADGLDPTSMESTVTVAEGVDLGVPQDTVEVTGTSGNTLPLSFEVNNVGEKAADGAVVLVFGDYPVSGAKQYSNCTFLNGALTSCTFDEQLEVGAGYTTNEVPLKLRSDTFAPSTTSGELVWLTKAEFELFKKIFEPDFLGSPGTGEKLSLVENASLNKRSAPPQTDIDGTNNGVTLDITVEGENGVDLAAVGGSASGAVTQVVTLNLGLHNVGPATIDFIRSDEPAGFFDLALPPGSSLAEMPARCIAMKQIGDVPDRDPDEGNLLARFIRCSNESRLFVVGTDWTIPVKLRIDQVITGATGTVTVVTKECACRPDTNPANNAANVVLNAALPTTGVQTGLLAGTGVLLALSGVAAFLLGRRRRFRVTDPG